LVLPELHQSQVPNKVLPTNVELAEDLWSFSVMWND